MAIPARYPVVKDGSGFTCYTMSVFSDGLACIRFPGGQEGYIDRCGKVAIPPIFRAARHFTEGLAAVKISDDTWQYIDKSGSIVCNGKQFVIAHAFAEGLAAVHTGGWNWGFIDRTGEWVIEPRPEWRWAHGFSEGLAAVDLRGGGTGYIDRQGRIVIASRDWFGRHNFRNGVATVRLKEEWRKYGYIERTYGYIDRSGKYIWKPTA
jgi:hypothetical protein